MSTLFHPLRVLAVRPEATDAVVVSFDVPEPLRPVFGFTQGQYLTLKKELDGRELRRSYSICAGVDDGTLRVGVRKVRGGAFSQWIHEALRAGDTVDVMAPQGRFFVPIEPAARRHHLGIAGGSGITPILSILKTVLAREPLSRFTLVYANRRLASAMFMEELEDLKNRHLARFALHRVFSDEPVDSAIGRGRADREKLSHLFATLIPAAAIDHAYVCGPFAMNDEAEAALRDAGVAPERIHVERFGFAQAVDAVSHVPQPGDAAHARIEIVRDGLRHDVVFRPGQASVLDAAVAAGVELPFSCTSGVCGTCRAKVLDGAVRMERNFALDAADIAAGFVLTCQAHPLGERVRLSFDER